MDAVSVLLGLVHHPCKYREPYKKWLAGINTNLFQIACLTKQSKEEIPLFLDQNIRPNMADILTKYDLNQKPEVWLELQNRLLNPAWLLPNISTWIQTVRQESETQIKIQASGGLIDYTGDLKNTIVEEAPLLEIGSVLATDQHTINIINFPSSDWSMVEQITTRFMSRTPRISLKIMGFVIFCAHKWRDLLLVKRYKSRKPYCGHNNFLPMCFNISQRQYHV